MARSLLVQHMADSDEIPMIADCDDARWAAAQRRLVEGYLQSQGCDHAGVSIEPRWHLSPYLAVWAVRSKSNPGLVGWWAISGDVPTDYLPASRDLRSTADVLSAFSAVWSNATAAMSRGEYAGIGDPTKFAELAPLLKTRSETLRRLSESIRADEAAE